MSDHQDHIVRLIGTILDMGHGGKRATRVRPHFLTTNYDFVLETLLDAHLGANGDPLFLYAYRGFTPTKIKSVPHVRVAFDHTLAFNLLKLNGGLEVWEDGPNFCLDYTQKRAAQTGQRPKLILPSREQDYSDRYVVELFRKSVRVLRESQALVIVGYSLPEEDALLRFLLRQFAESAEDSHEKFIFLIDIDPQVKRLEGLYKHHEHLGPPIHAYAGSFGDFAKATNALL